MSLMPLPFSIVLRLLLAFELQLIIIFFSILNFNFFFFASVTLISVRVNFPMYGSENNREDSDPTAFRRAEKNYKLYYDNNNGPSKKKKYYILFNFL